MVRIYILIFAWINYLGPRYSCCLHNLSLHSEQNLVKMWQKGHFLWLYANQISKLPLLEPLENCNSSTKVSWKKQFQMHEPTYFSSLLLLIITKKTCRKQMSSLWHSTIGRSLIVQMFWQKRQKTQSAKVWTKENLNPVFRQVFQNWFYRSK